MMTIVSLKQLCLWKVAEVKNEHPEVDIHLDTFSIPVVKELFQEMAEGHQVTAYLFGSRGRYREGVTRTFWISHHCSTSYLYHKTIRSIGISARPRSFMLYMNKPVITSLYQKETFICKRSKMLKEYVETPGTGLIIFNTYVFYDH
ncbi:MAG: hypothetical protein K940chlam3_01312 [Chlamydiae bacterium]|nr:hypothetical protein [Chlamydiota bacterium]